MMINILVKVVGMKEIKSIAKWNVLWDGIVSIHGNEMGRANHGIKMNYISNTPTIFIYVRFYDPHACVVIWLITMMRIPLYHCIWIDATLTLA